MRITLFAGGLLCGLIPALIVKIIGKDYLASSTSQLLLTTLIQVNATLIGFCGIIFVYFLKSTHDYRILLLKSMLATESNMEKFKLDNKLSDMDKWKLKNHRNRINFLYERLNETNMVLQNFAYIGISVMTCFLVSILLCITSLGKIEDVGLYKDWISYSLAAMFFGIGLLFIGIWLSIPEIQKKED